MDFKDVIQDRYSVRKFSDKPVEQEKIDAILEMARIAPTAGNRQPQRVMVYSGDADIAKIDLCTRSRYGAPLVFAICYDKDACWVRPFDNENSGQVDASIVTTYMMLEATAQGLGTVWVMHFNPAELISNFQIEDKYVPVALLVVGYPADDAEPSERHSQRMTLNEMLIK